MRVFTLAHWTSYNFFTASLIWRLLDLISTMNTSVLCSSIFFIADSVFNGLLKLLYTQLPMKKRKKTYETIVLNWSIRGAWLIDLRGYLGSRGSRRVLGRWKETDDRILRAAWECAPWRAAFFAALALLSFADGAANQSSFQKCIYIKKCTYSWLQPCPWGFLLWWPLLLLESLDTSHSEFLNI